MKLELVKSCGRADIICNNVRIAPDVDGKIAEEIVKRVNEYDKLSELHSETVKYASRRISSLQNEITRLQNELGEVYTQNRELVKVLKKAKEKIEEDEVEFDAEYNTGRTLEEILKAEEMPEVYYEILHVLKKAKEVE